ncbi:unknown [Prevotella sp. CAG:5226]|nr:unknown [Prevotella sp. CAG:5226]
MNCLKVLFSNCHKKGLLSEDMIVFYAKVSIFIILIGYDFAITIPTTSDVNAMQTWLCCKSLSIDRIPSCID